MRGKKSVKESLIKIFSANYIVRFYETVHPRHAEELSVNALNDGCDFLISVGGDGTLHEVVNGFLKSGGRGRFQSILGVLPYGTGNDFARGIGVTKNIDQLSEMISRNSSALLDAGCMEIHLSDGSVNTCYFDNIADLGIGADVVVQVNGVNLRKKILGGTLTFFLSVLTTFITFKPKNVRVSWDGFAWEGKVLSLVVANGRFFGSGLGVAPDAKLDDGMFEVVIFADLSVIDYLKNFARVRKSLRVMHPEAHYYRAKEIYVEPLGNKAIVEADGEIAGQAPVLYKCLPAAMPFLIP